MSDEKAYQFFASYIFDHTGITYSPNDYYRLDGRLQKLCKKFEVSSFIDLMNLYMNNTTVEMHTVLVDTATNNESYFFRDQKPFDALAEIVNSNNKKALKIWSCGCSTGQEPYSMLMTLKEKCPSFSLNLLQLSATDISQKAMDQAREGEYNTIEIQRGLPINLMVKYFSQDERIWKIKEELSNKVLFSKFNITKDPYPLEKYDIIFCRNVVIYQNMENKKKIIEGLFNSLKPGGYLFLGSGESLIGMNVTYEIRNLKDAHFFQKPIQSEKKSA